MKTRFSLSLGLTAIIGLGLSAVSADASGNIEMAVVAEQSGVQLLAAVPSPDTPVYYVALDGGYIEAGDPIANENPPGAAAVAQALQRELAEVRYQPATGPATPTLLFIYHWGLLCRDSHASENGNTIDPNLHARLSLITTGSQDRAIETYILDRELTGRINPAFRSPLFLNFPERDALSLSHDDRYFVVLSAYDFRSVSQRQPNLLWRVKMSTLGVGVSMADALPTLLHGGAPFLGRNLSSFQDVRVPIVAAIPVGAANGAERFSPPLGDTGSLDPQFLRGLMKKEHDEFSGTHRYDKVAYDPIVVATSTSAISSTPSLSPKQSQSL